ncbi:helix-turn-helix domain-containing protein [Nocardia sp. CA-129566]|uniref:helix-turn-helix domain-containing protein n=1 Tax=Nocardia sp. CA-129566 TaxID=3239976 RepID=UPI003D964059
MKTTKQSDAGQVSVIPTLFERLAARLDRVAPEITARIRAEVPGYHLLGTQEHAEDVDHQIRNVVAGLLTGAVPSEAAIEHARGVGRRRAAVGMAIPDVIEAYHIAYRDIWAELLSDAQRSDPPLAGDLTSVVGLLWLWFHRLSAAVADAHSAEIQLRRTNRLTLEREWLDQLTGRAPRDEMIAAELGYQVDGNFSVVCIAGLGQRDDADRLVDLLRDTSPRVACIPYDGCSVLVTQNLTTHQICTAVDAVNATARIGVGIARVGPAGAAVSLQDAQEALARATEQRRIVEFEHDWLMCCLTAIKPRFAALLEPAMAVAREHPRLAETVRAYADCGYSVSACARRLHIHPNSARYRLDRWRALTGHDVETVSGLNASVIALEMAG